MRDLEMPFDLQDALLARVRRHAPRQGANTTCLPGVMLYRFDRPNEPLHALYEPSICLIVQGRKRVLIGDQVLHYGPMRHLVVSQDLPMSGQVLQASPLAPYLCIAVSVSAQQIASLMLDIGRPAEPPNAGSAPGMYTEDSAPELMEASYRLIRLLDAPDDAPALAPLIQREILYRLLRSPNGWLLIST